MHLATSFIFISFITYLVDSHTLTTKKKERQGQLTNKCKMILSIAFYEYLYILKNFQVYRVRELLITRLRNHQTYTKTIQHTVLPVALQTYQPEQEMYQHHSETPVRL